MNMFGRNSQNAYSSGSYSSTTYGNSAYNAPSSQSLYRQQSTYQKIGYYRILDYDSQKLFGGIAKAQLYKDFTPMSISLRDETFHLCSIQTRVEDYYSIRTKNIEDKHRRSLQSCINKKVFNPDLVSNDSMASLKPVVSIAQVGLGPDAVEKVCNRVVSRYGNNQSPFAGRTNNSGGYSSSNNNPFNSTSSTTNRNNPFTSNQSTNMQSSNNPFSNNSSTNNMFASRNNNNSGNPFSSNNNNSSSGGNPFGNNNSGNPFGNNSGNNSGGMYGSTRYGNNSGNNNNPFSSNNNSGNRQGSNMFNNNSNPFNNNNNNSSNNNPFNNNNSNNNNPFNNNSNNSNPFNNNNNSNNNNPFNNNNNNSRNPFSNNNNNTSNNLFNNNNNSNNMFNNNNSNRGNNLFSGGGNSGGNNLFNNVGGGNNGGGMFNNGEIMQFAMLQMMREIADKFTGNNSGNANMGINSGYNGNYLDNNAADREYYQASDRIQKKYAQWFRDPFENDDAVGYRRKPKQADNRTIVIVKQGSQTLPNAYPSIQGSFIKNSTIVNNQQDPFNLKSHQNDSISASQYQKFYTSKNASFSPSPVNNEAQMLNNQNQVKRTTSTFMMDYSQGRQNSVYGTVKGKGDVDSMETSFIRGKANIGEGNGVRYWYKVCCMWSESFRKNYITRDQFQMQGQILVQNQPSQAQLTDLILTQIISQTHPKKIRRNATLTLQYPIPFTSSSSSTSSPKQFKIQGTLIHDKINVRKGYDYIYDSIDRWHVTNLTISCKYGCVQWRGQTVYIEDVDFQNQIVFDEEGVLLDGVLEEEYDKNVTLNWLPKSVQGELPDQGKARAVMEYEIKRARKKSKNQGIRLIQINFQKNFYTVKIPKFKTPPSQTPQN